MDRIPLMIGTLRAIKSPSNSGLRAEGGAHGGVKGRAFSIVELDEEVDRWAVEHDLDVRATSFWDDATPPSLSAIRPGVLATLDILRNCPEPPGKEVRPHYMPFGYGTVMVSCAASETPRVSIDGDDTSPPPIFHDVASAFGRGAKMHLSFALCPGASTSLSERLLLRGLTHGLCHGAARVRLPHGTSEDTGRTSIKFEVSPGHGWGLTCVPKDVAPDQEPLKDLAGNFMYDIARHGIGYRQVRVDLVFSRNPTPVAIGFAAGQIFTP